MSVLDIIFRNSRPFAVFIKSNTYFFKVYYILVNFTGTACIFVPKFLQAIKQKWIGNVLFSLAETWILMWKALRHHKRYKMYSKRDSSNNLFFLRLSTWSYVLDFLAHSTSLKQSTRSYIQSAFSCPPIWQISKETIKS